MSMSISKATRFLFNKTKRGIEQIYLEKKISSIYFSQAETKSETIIGNNVHVC
jgi:hypothetical protein